MSQKNGVNKVFLIGRTGQDSRLKFTSSGKPVANFSLAVDESFKNAKGELQQRVLWVRCVAWQRLAEVCGEYATKGRLLFIEGRLQTRKYDDRDANQRTVTEVVVEQLRFLDGSKNGARAERPQGRPPRSGRPEPPKTRTHSTRACPFEKTFFRKPSAGNDASNVSAVLTVRRPNGEILCLKPGSWSRLLMQFQKQGKED